ncbi:hypothetical protein N8D56_04785 [Devosia sp. A8/3-2]|nr:hypothetical protein N8D56_04785 [Devosia sp. A8/3-2]
MSKQSREMGLPYGPGLVSFGFDPASLILVRPANMVELLWAAEEALACKAVAAVIADIADQPKILDFTASRRLSLRAASSGTSFLLLRYGTGRGSQRRASALAAHPRAQRPQTLRPSCPRPAALAGSIGEGGASQAANRMASRLDAKWIHNARCCK